MEAIKPEPLVKGHSTGNRGNKIALEEHFSIPALLPKPEEVSFFDPDVIGQVDSLLPDLTQERLVKMDQARIEIAVLSQTAPGVQAIADSQVASHWRLRPITFSMLLYRFSPTVSKAGLL